MTNEQILKKIIEKAVKNGYKGGEYAFDEKISVDRWRKEEIISFIFSHDFAKCLWGEKIKCNECDLEQKKHKITKRKYFYSCSNCGILVEGQYAQESWKNHLQKLVLEKEPLKYIAKFL